MNKELKITLRVDSKTGKLSAVSNEFSKLDTQVTKTHNSIDGLKGALAAMGGLASLVILSRYADTFTRINNKIALVAQSEEALVETRQKLLNIANETGAATESTVELYTRMHQATEQLNYSQTQLLGITSSISKALTISGGSAQSAEAALLQLSQGFASGTLRGQELNSVMEQAPRLARAIADGLKIPYGDLRKVAEQGGLTTVKVMEALESQSNTIALEFAKTKVTISSSFVVLKNSITEVVGVIDKSFGASSAVSANIVSLGEALKNNIGIISTVAKQVVVLGLAYATVKALSMAKMFLGQSIAGGTLANTFRLMTSSSVGLAIGISRMGASLKTLALSFAPMAAIIVLYETWSYFAGEVAKKEAEVTRILGFKNKALRSLTSAQALHSLTSLKQELQTRRETTQELSLQLRIARGRRRVTNDKTIAIQAQLDGHIQNTNAVKEQIALLQSVVNGTYMAVDATVDAANTAAALADELSRSKNEAIALAQALGATQLAIGKQVLRAKALAGELTKRQEITLGFKLDKESFAVATQVLRDKMNEAIKTKDSKAIDKITQDFAKLALAEISAQNNLTQTLENLEKRKIKTVKKSNRAKIASVKRYATVQTGINRNMIHEAKSVARTLQEAQAFNREFTITSPSIVGEFFNPYTTLIQAQREYFVNLQREGITQKQQNKIHAKHTADRMKGYAGLTNGARNFFDAGTKGYRSLDAAQRVLQAFEFAWFMKKEVLQNVGLLSKLTGIGTETAAVIASETKKGVVIGANAIASQAQGEPHTAWARMAAMAAAITALGIAVGGGGGGAVSEAQKKEATGRSDFSDSSYKDMSGMFKDIMQPHLTVSKTMSRHLESMDNNFLLISRSIMQRAGGSGIDLSGASYNAVSKESALGFSSSSRELLGTGLDLSGTMGNFSAQGYVSELIKESSWWGLSSSESTSTQNIQLPSHIQSVFSQILNDGMAQVVTASASLGFDADHISQTLANYQIDIGKINLDGLSQSEAQERISAVFSEIFSGAVSQLSGINEVVEKYAQSGEESIATLARVAVSHEYVQAEMRLMGQGLGDLHASMAMVNGAGGIRELQESIASYQSIFYSEIEQSGMGIARISTQFANLGVVMPKTNEGFRDLLESLDTSTEAGARLYGELMGLGSAFDSTVGAVRRTISSLREAQSAYQTQIPITSSQIYENISDFANIGNDTISSQISSWASAQIATANKQAQAQAQARQARTTARNKDIAANNSLRSTILSLRDTVYTSFRGLQDFSVEALQNNLVDAVNNKEYKKIGSAFNSYTSSLKDSSGSREVFLRGLAEANALVQGIDAPALQASIATSSASTSASASRIAEINRQAYEKYEWLILQNEAIITQNDNSQLINEEQAILANDAAVRFQNENISLAKENISLAKDNNKLVTRLIRVTEGLASAQREITRNDAERLTIEAEMRA